MLVSTDVSINEVGARCGYHEAKWLIALFQSQVGMPPGAFRHQTRMGRGISAMPAK